MAYLHYLVIFVIQVILYVLVTLDINFTRDKKTFRALATAGMISIVLLGNTLFAINAWEKNDFLVVLFYVSGAIVGMFIGLKMRPK